MNEKAKNPAKDEPRREVSKRPFQDDTVLIMAVALILIVAQCYYFKLARDFARPKKVAVKVEGEDVARAVAQDLSGQRHNIENHIKKFLAVPQRQPDEDRMARLKPFFSAEGWQAYQQYTTMVQKALADGQSMRAEFVVGSQKYTIFTGDITAFHTEGLFCLGTAPQLKCGPQGFSMRVLLRGSVNNPDALQFEEWKVMPPRSATAATADAKP